MPASHALDIDALVAWFHDAAKEEDRLGIGFEWEKEAVDGSGRHLTFFEDGGVHDILRGLADRFGWSPVHEGANVVALDRAGEAITLEPAGQVELGTRVERTVAALDRAVRAHLDELHAVLRPDAHLLTTAYTPFQPVADIPFVPKGRYDVMKEYLGARGELAHGMMKGTTSVQVALDYRDEADCRAKFESSVAISPLVTALCANSPLVGGKPSGLLCHRALTWTKTDPDRTGLLDALLAQPFSFERYVDWVLDVPLMFVYIGGSYRAGNGMTYRQWAEQGIDGVFPDGKAWETHLTSVFPEVRVKNFVELRGADNGSVEQIVAVGALWTGLLYDDVALDQAVALGRELMPHRNRALADGIRRGLRAEVAGRGVADWVAELSAIARAGLLRRGEDPASLDWIDARVDRGCSPAEDVLELRERFDDEGLVRALAYPR